MINRTGYGGLTMGSPPHNPNGALNSWKDCHKVGCHLIAKALVATVHLNIGYFIGPIVLEGSSTPDNLAPKANGLIYEEIDRLLQLPL